MIFQILLDDLPGMQTSIIFIVSKYVPCETSSKIAATHDIASSHTCGHLKQVFGWSLQFCKVILVILVPWFPFFWPTLKIVIFFLASTIVGSCQVYLSDKDDDVRAAAASAIGKLAPRGAEDVTNRQDEVISSLLELIPMRMKKTIWTLMFSGKCCGYKHSIFLEACRT